jgi:cytochrome c2
MALRGRLPLSRLLAGGLAVVTLLWTSGSTGRGQAPAAEVRRDWGPWLEADAPFFSSVIDARGAGGSLPTDNLAPRALVLPAGPGLWLAFDPDLLRAVAVWQGPGVTPTALAPGSYHAPDRKTPVGQKSLPEPSGTVWTATGVYAGWQTGEHPSLDDPRAPAPSPEEVGRGPLAADDARFEAVCLTREGAVLEYRVAATTVQEWVTSTPIGSGAHAVVRHLEVGPSAQTHWLMIGTPAASADVSLSVRAPGLDRRSAPSLETIASTRGTTVRAVRIPPHASTIRFAVAIATGGPAPTVAPRAMPTAPAAARWPSAVTTHIVTSGDADAYVVEDVPLPLDNPWRRNVRISDIQFLADGTGVGVTIDGDVWLLRGLASRDGTVRWRRFASGLHEPLTVAIRDEQIHVFDRNGVWRLRDTDGDGEADRHELFSNAFTQTADMREFPSTIRLGPGGEFVIAKGGQEAATIGRHNGSVLRLSADGRTATVLGYGLRQPQLAVHPQSGLVTASDQQGHYIPSTPLHIVRDRQFYGFLSDILPREVYPAPIAAPLTWIPHSVNASGMSQVWLDGARMGPLDEGLVHIGYNRPELFRVLLDLDRPMSQAAVVSLTTAFDHPPLNGSVNPEDGQLYIAGFQILGWGTTATRQAGLSRVRYTGAPVTVPRQVTPMREGILLRFDVRLDKAAAEDATSYRVATWQYMRTYRYGSPQYKADGTTGTDVHTPSGAYLSADGRGVFIAVPDMRPVMQLEVGWTLRTPDGRKVEGQAYTTPYALESFSPRVEGFGDLVLDLTRREPAPPAPPGEISLEEGRQAFVKYGCLACHGTERGATGKLGPTLAGVYGSTRRFSEGKPPLVADEAYLRESIREPAARIVDGYDRGGTGMPSFAGVLTPEQVESLILFIKTLH